jgi:hypothetical protein
MTSDDEQRLPGAGSTSSPPRGRDPGLRLAWVALGLVSVLGVLLLLVGGVWLLRTLSAPPPDLTALRQEHARLERQWAAMKDQAAADQARLAAVRRQLAATRGTRESLEAQVGFLRRIRQAQDLQAAALKQGLAGQPGPARQALLQAERQYQGVYTEANAAGEVSLAATAARMLQSARADRARIRALSRRSPDDPGAYAHTRQQGD